MQVLSVRCGMTKNLGNFESAKLEVEAAPSDGQTADQLLAEVNGYLNKQCAALPVSANGNGKSDKPAKGKAAEAPLKTSEQKSYEQVVAEATELLSPNKTNTDKKAAANANKPDTGKELRYALESETLEELLDRFNGVRKMARDFGDKWEEAVTKIADRYRKLNSLDANPETLDALVKAFKAERQHIENKKHAEVAS